MTEQQKEYRREYYKKNRYKVDTYNQNWLDKNRDKWNAYILERYHKKKEAEKCQEITGVPHKCSAMS